MAGELRKWRERRWLWSAALLSLLAHLIVLGALGVATPRPAFREIEATPTLTVQLLPRIARTRPRSPAAAPATSIRTAAAAAGASSSPQSARRPLPSASSPPAPVSSVAHTPSPVAGTGAQNRSGIGESPGYLPYAEGGRGVGALLRGTVGCSNEGAAHLSASEREACTQRFGQEARKAAPFVGIDPAKRAYYDAVQQRYQTMHDPNAPVPLVARGSLGLFEDESRVIGGQMVGHGAGLGCGLKWGPGTRKKDMRSIADKIKQDAAVMVDLGPLKCGVVIPQGSLTPDIGIKP